MGDPLNFLFTPFSSIFLEKLLEQIEVTQTQYDQAQRAYKSLGNWLDRDKSTLRLRSPSVYVQGSFRLGTAIKPSSANGDLDIDVVCEILGRKSSDTQKLIKDIVGVEVKSYADAHNIKLDVPGKRCWTLLYADGSKFHMDVLPALPDAEGRRLLLEQHQLDT
ncbi:nucleotidyltransferase [Pseudovibrio brasiliensis]|uniref:Nucleotidyltransferase n=1 Tax=Pseudovibrio brasiliensis TaxID=1898042 RepID=A0ABX8AL40_9HYPH|nr:nucleotidyltransferase [Pseudovibrio brasiliensis]QUS55303.1 nucleotidyltransferase [Pseudovibrio brasiliensis]